jgi:hypothetical protein
LGLSIMQERADDVNAHLTIHSRLEAGTDVRVSWTHPEAPRDQAAAHPVQSSNGSSSPDARP